MTAAENLARYGCAADAPEPRACEMAELGLSCEPLSERLITAAQWLATRLNDREFDAISWDTEMEIRALSVTLAGMADDAREMEERARPQSRRERRMTPLGRIVKRIVGKVK